MRATSQVYWEQANWGRLAEDITNGRFIASHKYFEDLRKRIFLLLFPQAGASVGDEHIIEYTPDNFSTNLGDIAYYIGESIVTWEDPDYGWLYWFNKIELTREAANQNVPPPISIHPDDNEWVFENERWKLHADWNKYHQWDKNSPFCFAVTAARGSTTTGNLTVQLYAGEAYKFLPYQTDPKEQYPPVIHSDGYLRWQHRKKVKCLRKYITQLDTLGPVLACIDKRWNPWNYQWSGGTSNRNFKYNYVPYDQYAMIPVGGIGHRSQYGNGGGLSDTPGGDSGGGDFPQRLPLTSPFITGNYKEYYFNQKVNYAFQNRIETVLDSVTLRHLVDGDWKANFRTQYSVSAGLEDTNGNYESHPDAYDALWGCNESGFELFLKQKGSYDWYFDYRTPYVPKALSHEIAYRIGKDSPENLDTLIAYYELDILIGTWRRTWKNSMGRISPFMRSYEMGQPNLYDAWGKQGSQSWCWWWGSRKTSWPTINQFDTGFIEIATLNTPQTLIAAGDLTGNLDIGWLVHLCPAQNSSIENMQYGYIVNLRYDEDGDVTYITLSCVIGEGINYIGYNPDISRRHDPCTIGKGNSPGYNNAGSCLLEMHNLLKIAKYVRTNFSLTVKTQDSQPALFVTGYNPSTYLVAAAENLLDSMLEDPDDWTDANPGFIGAQMYIAGSRTTGEWMYWGSLQMGPIPYRFTERAFKLAVRDPLTKQYGNAFIRINYKSCPNWPESWNVGQPLDACIPATFDVGETTVKQPVNDNQTWHYLNLCLRVDSIENQDWLRLRVTNPLPGLDVCREEPKYQDGVHYWTHYFAAYYVPLNITYDNPFVMVNWEKVPASVWSRCLISHYDDPDPYVPDTNPPKPDPPVHHQLPYAYFKYIPEDEENEIEEHLELRLAGDCCLCEDLEGSEPVKYILREQTEDYLTEWSTQRTYDILVRELTIKEALGDDWHNLPIDSVTTNPSGTVTRIPITDSGLVCDIGDTIGIRGTGLINGEWEVLAYVEDSYIEIDTEDFFRWDKFQSGSQITNLSARYDEDEWDAEDCKYWLLAWQAKDSAEPQNNLTEVGDYKDVEAPAKWPYEVYIAEKNKLMNI